MLCAIEPQLSDVFITLRSSLVYFKPHHRKLEHGQTCVSWKLYVAVFGSCFKAEPFRGGVKHYAQRRFQKGSDSCSIGL